MRKDRLLRLADFLDTLEPERFDISMFVGRDWDGKPDLSCGTTACAVGWATTLPDMGLGRLILMGGGITAGGKSPYLAALDAFDISWKQFDYLFMYRYETDDGRVVYPDSLPPTATPTEVAHRIRLFVDGFHGGRKIETSP